MLMLDTIVEKNKHNNFVGHYCGEEQTQQFTVQQHLKKN